MAVVYIDLYIEYNNIMRFSKSNLAMIFLIENLVLIHGVMGVESEIG